MAARGFFFVCYQFRLSSEGCVSVSVFASVFSVVFSFLEKRENFDSVPAKSRLIFALWRYVIRSTARTTHANVATFIVTHPPSKPKQAREIGQENPATITERDMNLTVKSRVSMMTVAISATRQSIN